MSYGIHYKVYLTIFPLLGYNGHKANTSREAHMKKSYKTVLNFGYFILTILIGAALIVALPSPSHAQSKAQPQASSQDKPLQIIESIIPENKMISSDRLKGVAGEILKEPICFKVINKAPYGILGTVVTDVFHGPQGAARHRSNFNLKENESTEFCSYGPFYEGGKLELVVRTLVPVFSCKTRVDADIEIHGRRKEKGGTDTWAICR
jgi:hypothetical protein